MLVVVLPLAISGGMPLGVLVVLPPLTAAGGMLVVVGDVATISCQWWDGVGGVGGAATISCC